MVERGGTGAAWSCGAVEFAAALDRVAPAARSPLLGPVAGLDADAEAGTVRVHAHDGRQTITVDVAAEVSIDGALVVSHDILSGLMRGLTGGVGFAAEKSALAVEGDGTTATVRMADGLALPGSPPDPGGGVPIAAGDLRRAIQRVEKSTEAEGPKSGGTSLTGLNLHEHDGRLWLAAADGYAMALAVVGAYDASPLSLPAVLPGGPARTLGRLLGGCGAGANVRVAVGADAAHVFGAGWSWSCRLMEGAHPDCWAVLDRRPEETASAVLDRDALRSATEAAAWFAGANRADRGVGGAAVRIDLDPDGAAVSASDADRGEASRRVAGVVEGGGVWPQGVKIGANYLRDALAAMAGDEAAVSFAGEGGVVVLREADGGPDRWGVMVMVPLAQGGG